MFITPATRAEAVFELPLLSDRGARDPRPQFIEAHSRLSSRALAVGHFYRVREGCLSLHRQIDAERRQILDILGPGRLLDHAIAERLLCEVVAFAPTHIEPVEDHPFMLKKLAAAHQQIMLDRALGHLTRLGRLSAGERVAEAILDLAAQYGTEAPISAGASETFPFHLGRGDLADWLGLTLETVSRCMSRLKQDGVISFGKDPVMTIRDRRALNEIAKGTRKLQSLYAPRHIR